MNYSKSSPLYQDRSARYATALTGVIIWCAIFLAAGIFMISRMGAISVGLFMLFFGLVLGFLIWVRIPRRYEVHQDHLSIVLGIPFSVNIGFNKIKTITAGTRWFAYGITWIFTTSWWLGGKYVEISIDRIGDIAITPRDTALFTQNANQALSQWVKNNTT